MREFKFKKFYERLENLSKEFQNLTSAHYALMSMLVPESRPTRKEVEMLKKRKKEKLVPLEKIEKRLKDVQSSS
ncbi:MAG: hypothetical protein ACP5O8_03870 [Candidatus Aenigmatarchaeota archaeon]